MAIQESGLITLSDLQDEFGGTNPISMSEYYAGGTYVDAAVNGVGGNVPSSGALSFSDFYGTEALKYFTVQYFTTPGYPTYTPTSGATSAFVMLFGGIGDHPGGGVGNVDGMAGRGYAEKYITTLDPSYSLSIGGNSPTTTSGFGVSIANNTGYASQRTGEGGISGALEYSAYGGNGGAGNTYDTTPAGGGGGGSRLGRGQDGLDWNASGVRGGQLANTTGTEAPGVFDIQSLIGVPFTYRITGGARGASGVPDLSTEDAAKSPYLSNLKTVLDTVAEQTNYGDYGFLQWLSKWGAIIIIEGYD